ncbi:MBL fold metallo-hydrolase [Paenibacillus polymyxa]|uniref:MBL fold metallo-hydrolase n=1 Tax=Paenibacillus polymyxa TaxID=1406 RepID=UPI0025B70E76|nr:MBL fold metallo-hydrolase [Paenibacillus polymyxa]MDN4084807.1 MBL fold metallo-hydrolase [Paenibacillus polymyxa]MDN4086787.1 MBL fold metallo-hydrolase [Paenibacillus polymyxa]MDN4108413.1 MBL fold metallo-hydrolase [Paenibacillus polymyxa]
MLRNQRNPKQLNMNIGTQILILEVSMGPFFGNSIIHPVLLKDEDGLTLIDSGMLGQLEPLRKAISDVGEDISRLKRIIITHQDIDHIGNVQALLDLLPSTALLAHKDDIPYMTGERPFIKLTPERINLMEPALKQQAEDMIRRLPDLRFAHMLEDGEHLPYGGGIQIIHTPGHTPGHISLYAPAHKLLLAADELRVVEGELVGPAESATPDMPLALKSLDKLTVLDVDKVLCYHGGYYDQNVQARLQALSQSRE